MLISCGKKLKPLYNFYNFLLSDNNNYFLIKNNDYLIKLINIFQKTGLKQKCILVILSLYDNIFIKLNNQLVIEFKKCNINQTISKLNNSNQFFLQDFFSLVIIFFRVSKRIRKYSKGKLRYKKKILLLQSRKRLKFFFKLLKFCLIDNVLNNNFKNFLLIKFYLFLLNDIDACGFSLIDIQNKMLTSYIKKK